MVSDNVLSLRDWFQANKRVLPWRNTPSPYRVWVSEMMLQQTQVSTVLPYFDRWMEKFPNVIALANASSEEVMKAWEGLGYYSRARRLHDGCKLLVSLGLEDLVSDEHILNQIEGLGPYTKAAVLAFAFHQKIAVVDGNVARVLARFFEESADIKSQKTLTAFRKKLLDCLPDEKPWEISEAMIELGAMVCKPTLPKCYQCPLQQNCKAFQNQTTMIYPVAAKRKKTQVLHQLVFLVRHDEKLLARQNDEKKIMHGLWELPSVEIDPELIEPLIFKKIAKYFPDAISIEPRGEKISHTFTHHKMWLYPYEIKVKEQNSLEITSKIYHWNNIEKLKQKSFNSGQRKILAMYLA